MAWRAKPCPNRLSSDAVVDQEGRPLDPLRYARALIMVHPARARGREKVVLARLAGTGKGILTTRNRKMRSRRRSSNTMATARLHRHPAWLARLSGRLYVYGTATWNGRRVTGVRSLLPSSPTKVRSGRPEQALARGARPVREEPADPAGARRLRLRRAHPPVRPASPPEPSCRDCRRPGTSQDQVAGHRHAIWGRQPCE